MNGKRAKVLRKVAKIPNVIQYVSIFLNERNEKTHVFESIGERQVYQHVKKQDKKLCTPDKELFSANQIRSTLP